MTRDLNDTLIFLRVVREGSFSGAASALQVPKTTVSRRVQELERHLGAQLLHRTTRKLRLTEAGEAYFEQCHAIAGQLDAAEHAVHQLRAGPRGWLRVTLPYSFGVAWIAPLISGFCSRYPEVRLEIVATHVTLDLFAEEVDIALRLGVLPDSSLVARRLGSFATSVYASPGYLEKNGAPAGPDDLRHHPALTLHQARGDGGYTWPLHKAGRKPRHYALNPVIVASDPALILDAARADQGVILAMDMSMEEEVRTGRLCRVLPEWEGPPQDLNAIFPRERVPSPKVHAFVQYLRERLDFVGHNK
ncbi:LysR family transcriptional regulator [Burkholderia sp. WAC0059]|uniref:LysR family transcriptional regulator n=1 Tax=Burkholderia sp. WAC0059 TaxID=2066022 RepID=UPI000C7EA74B|nr:LysR family transcriptional regulator [Burkholderia sp. WAC0059]PLZ01762.1 LysR family transcriptional regulator [Burkholderia sp. WAC0059]